MESSRLALLLTATLLAACMVQLASAQSSPQDFVDAHNSARQADNVGLVSWDLTLASYAENYANQQTSSCLPLTHSGGPYGENLFWGSGKEYTADDAVTNWVSEKQYYDYTSNTCASGEECRHYTQVVWAASTRIGCAEVNCNDGSNYIICEYDPQGNIEGQRPY